MKTIYYALWIALAACMSCRQEIPSRRVVTNPIDLNYSFHREVSMESLAWDIPGEILARMSDDEKNLALAALRQRDAGSAGAREAADPVVEIYKGRYWLFPSKSKGYWSSEDMQHWDYIPCDALPIDLYAPTAMVYKGELYWMVSDINHLYKTSTPEDGSSWEMVTDHLVLYPDEPSRTGHDPDLFLDDDGRVYLYWGCSDVSDIMGIELDPSKGFAPVGKEVTLITHREAEFGWEQPGDVNEIPKPGYNEGPSLFKHDGKYYLQYAAPGTEFDPYGDGLYVGTNPLGPFEHADYSPISVKPGGWMTGAGHGDTFRDQYGNLWHVASTVISQRMNFERRIGFFPMVMTPKGHLYAMTEWSDYPYVLPDGPVDFSVNPPWTGWMDLSIGKEIHASSELEGHSASQAADNSIKTWWSAVSGNAGEWISIDLGNNCRVHAIQTNFADEGFGYYDEASPKTPYRYVVEASKDGKTWKKLFDKSLNDTDNPHALLVLDKPVRTRFIRLVNASALTGKMSVYDLRVFGLADGKSPEPVREFKMQRGVDERRIHLSWQATEGAQGYILHWGTDPDELYSTCQTMDEEIELGLFSRGQSYFFRVDSFNESGCTSGETQALYAYTPEQAMAYLRSLTSHPDRHIIEPDRSAARKSPYKRSKNYGKRIAVFGGSLSVNEESDAAKQIWADLLNAEVTTFGVGGAGFSCDQGYSLQKQVDTAGVYDVYVLWASTNDYTNGRECGTWKDYTEYDGFDESRLSTQCGGINYCIRKLMEKNPSAEIYFFTSLRFFGSDSGHNPFSDEANWTGKTFGEYIDGQKACCIHYGIPVLDQFNLQGINRFNCAMYYQEDLLHMNDAGYRKIGPVQAAFLANGK